MAVISFQQNKSQSRLFAKREYSSLKVVFALLLSLSLMITDHHERSLSSLRSGFSVIASPLQFAVDYPVRVMGWIHSLFESKKALIDENMRLRYQQTMLEAHLQTFLTIQAENSELKSLLAATSSENTRAMAAQILAVETTSSRQLLVLNKGSRDGVLIGQPVLDAKGVMGQIIDVGLLTSTVLLISDAKCAVPVRNDRTGERAILVGMNNMTKLSLINLSKTSSIAKGDLLVTSGLGRRYPEGYPVGRVVDIKNKTGDDFITVTVSPVALLNRSRLVLLIWPEESHNELTVQINERLRALEGLA